MDAEFTLVSNHTKIAKKYSVLAEKWPFFQRVLKMADFGQNAKGGTLCKILEIGRFFGWTSEGSKNRKYLTDFSLICMDGRGIYSSF